MLSMISEARLSLKTCVWRTQDKLPMVSITCDYTERKVLSWGLMGYSVPTTIETLTGTTKPHKETCYYRFFLFSVRLIRLTAIIENKIMILNKDSLQMFHKVLI